jgi:hypothetical protein
LAIVPANAVTHLAGSLIQRLEMQDIRYDITTFGPFLKLLPLRLGRYKALDAAVDALQTAFRRDSHGPPTTLALKKYGIALKALHDGLASPDARRHNVELICAIYMIMLVQVRSPLLIPIPILVPVPSAAHSLALGLDRHDKG